MTAGAGVVGVGCRAHQGVVMAAGAAGAANGHEAAMVEGGGRMQRIPGAAVAAGTVARPGLADGRTDQAAVAASWQLVQALWVSAAALTRVSLWQSAQLVAATVTRPVLVGGRDAGLPGAGMAAGTVAADRKGGAERRAEQAAIRIVTAAAGVVGLGGSTDQGVVVAVGAAGAADGHQHGMVDGRGMLDVPAAGMAGHTLAAADRNPGLQVQTGRVRVAVQAIVPMSEGHGAIVGRYRIVTGQACGRVRHITEIRMVDVSGQGLVRMAIQAMGRVGPESDGVDDLLTRAVMAGRAGPRPVGRNIVLNVVNLRPVRDDMAVAARLSRRIIGQIVRADFPGMRKAFIMIGPLGRVAVGTADRGPVQPLLNGLPHGSGLNPCAAVVVTEGTVSPETTPCRASTSAATVKSAGPAEPRAELSLVWHSPQRLSMIRLLCAVAVAWPEERFSWQVSQLRPST